MVTVAATGVDLTSMLLFSYVALLALSAKTAGSENEVPEVEHEEQKTHSNMSLSIFRAALFLLTVCF